ncbi:extracytoplasmic-function sigma-70 factor [Isoalcanivorax pacificus W11-5]|uniref:Extracytoplasmic-function sigma-70 factor n=1 Tax=Isoalcanivorax pacificus W11-5 TaxID=391936 RepID=A0A0B4XLD5_9GAMM|nr:RNA polymerase factor sigma-70 [Isoalcanivorax pacificus]AJD47475.1 extracytoplasmic-function sigma-70 factor [Isoalcanivorax pacificus W11-5]
MQTSEQRAELEHIFVTHRTRLCHAAMKILGNRERADDVVHDAYLKIIETDAALEVRRPMAYAFQVVRNLAIDRHRRNAFESGVFACEEEGEHVAAPTATPEVIAISRQDLELLAQAMAQLPERTRRAFEMYRIGGETQREIAAQLGVSTTLVNFMIRDALTHCRAALYGE